MAEYGSVMTLVTPGPDLTLNAATGETYLLDPEMCSGLDMAPLRKPVEDMPQSDGGIVFPGFYGPRHIVLGGWLLVRTHTSDTDYRTKRATLEDNALSALESIRNANGTFTFNPIGGARVLTVQAEIAFETNGKWLKRFSFGLVAADPTW